MLYLLQYVSSLIKDEQLCASGDAVSLSFYFLFQCPDFPLTCGMAEWVNVNVHQLEKKQALL